MILVTGESGLLGSALVERLTADGVFVATASRGGQGPHHVRATVSRPLIHQALEALPFTPECVIHLAGMVRIRLTADPNNAAAPPIPADYVFADLYEANVLGTAYMTEYCLAKGVRRMIFASSQSVYGLPFSQPIDEETPPRPLEHYAASKIAAEGLLETASRQGLHITVLRIPGIYGQQRTSGIVYQFCKRAISNRQIEVFSDFPVPLDVIHVEDVTEAFVAATQRAGKPFRRFNIATGEPCSLTLLADEVAAQVPGCHVEHREVKQPVIRLDPTRAELELGWKARPRAERVAQMLDSIESNVT